MDRVILKEKEYFFNTKLLSQSSFWKYSYGPVIILANSLLYLQASTVFTIFHIIYDNCTKILCKKFSKAKNWWSKRKKLLLSFFPVDVSKERFPSQEYLFSFAIPHPVPNIAGKLMMKIVRQDLIAVNSSFLHRSINFIRPCRFICGTFLVTRISLPSCPPPKKKPHPTPSKI